MASGPGGVELTGMGTLHSGFKGQKLMPQLSGKRRICE